LGPTECAVCSSDRGPARRSVAQGRPDLTVTILTATASPFDTLPTATERWAAHSARPAWTRVLRPKDLMTIAMMAEGILVSLAIAVFVLLAVSRHFWRPRMLQRGQQPDRRRRFGKPTLVEVRPGSVHGTGRKRLPGAGPVEAIWIDHRPFGAIGLAFGVSPQDVAATGVESIPERIRTCNLRLL
jgi:hypothetical protein